MSLELPPRRADRGAVPADDPGGEVQLLGPDLPRFVKIPSVTSTWVPQLMQRDSP